jgi:homoserine kinase
LKNELQIKLPATSANLGPAFDAAALAFSLFLKIEATVNNEFAITARGRDADICREIEDHLILTTYREVLQAEDKTIIPLRLHIENEIPIGKGCGSSAAARLAGIALANHFGRLHWTDARIVGEAAWREHHPDNAAACWMGGLAIARMSAEREAQIVRITPKGKWPLLLAIPDESLPTVQARRILPEQYSRADVVTNIQNSMLLLAAFSHGRGDLLSTALDDRVHQPYRAQLCPLLPALQPLSGSKGILGVALSGAGPSVLIFLDPKVRRSEVQRRVQNQLSTLHLPAELIETVITNRGASLSARAMGRRSRGRKPSGSKDTGRR